MKKKIILGIATVFLLAALYFSIQWYWLQKTTSLPYCNLRSRGTSSNYIVFNVKNDNNIYKIAMPNQYAEDALVRQKGRLFIIFYPLYMNEIIRHNLSIEANDSLFSDIDGYAVDDKLVEKFRNYNLKNDTTIFDKHNRLIMDLSQDEQNAVIYLLLKNNMNCWIDCYSGATFVSR